MVNAMTKMPGVIKAGKTIFVPFGDSAGANSTVNLGIREARRLRLRAGTMEARELAARRVVVSAFSDLRLFPYDKGIPLMEVDEVAGIKGLGNALLDEMPGAIQHQFGNIFSGVNEVCQRSAAERDDPSMYIGRTMRDLEAMLVKREGDFWIRMVLTSDRGLKFMEERVGGELLKLEVIDKQQVMDFLKVNRSGALWHLSPFVAWRYHRYLKALNLIEIA